MARPAHKSAPKCATKQRLRYQPPRTLKDAWDSHARHAAVLLAGERSRRFSGRLGMCARKCNSTLAKARQIATMLDGADPKLWDKVKSGNEYFDGPNRARIPTAPRRQIMWMTARAFRDFWELMRSESMTREIVDEIAERQRNAISILSAPSPMLTADTADELMNESAVKRQREQGAETVPAAARKKLR